MSDVSDQVRCFVISIVSLGLIIGSVKDLDPNEVAFDYDHNVGLIVDDKILYQGGRHFLGLGHDFIKYPRTVQTLNIPNQQVRSADGLEIYVLLTVQYIFSPLNAETLKNLYYSFENEYEKAFIFIIEATLRDISSQYYAFDFYEKRSKLQTDLHSTLNQIFLTNLSVSIEDLQLVNIELTDSLSEEIQNTELAKQDSLRALNERDVSLLQLSTRIGQSYLDVDILNLNRDNKVNLTLTAALSRADTIISIYLAETTAFASVIGDLNLTASEVEAYMFMKALEGTSAKVHLSIDNNQQLIN